MKTRFFVWLARSIREKNILVLEDATCMMKTVREATPRDRDAGAPALLLLSGHGTPFLARPEGHSGAPAA